MQRPSGTRAHKLSPVHDDPRRETAEHLVENGGLVKEAAQRVGFADPYHFSRAFKAVHGVAPRALLRYRHGAGGAGTILPAG